MISPTPIMAKIMSALKNICEKFYKYFQAGCLQVFHVKNICMINCLQVESATTRVYGCCAGKPAWVKDYKKQVVSPILLHFSWNMFSECVFD